uniref:Uncharacterized protein n=1 Tax=viral metagenome TaxID=1070528 RepID=A0A6C0H825_9ZZZZ
MSIYKSKNIILVILNNYKFKIIIFYKSKIVF